MNKKASGGGLIIGLIIGGAIGFFGGQFIASTSGEGMGGVLILPLTIVGAIIGAMIGNK